MISSALFFHRRVVRRLHLARCRENRLGNSCSGWGCYPALGYSVDGWSDGWTGGGGFLVSFSYFFCRTYTSVLGWLAACVCGDGCWIVVSVGLINGLALLRKQMPKPLFLVHHNSIYVVFVVGAFAQPFF